MPSLDDVARHQTRLSAEDVEWLHLLVADWQIMADLSFADLVLWIPDSEQRGFWAAAQMRPTTGMTSHLDDLVGGFVPWGKRPMIDTAYVDGRIVREGDPEWHEDIPVRVEAIPVRAADHIVGVITRNTNLLGVRTPSRLELAYLRTAGELTTMVSEGTFPTLGERADLADAPRVGDGFVRTDADGVVSYASPNAISAYRRLGLTGELIGTDLAATTELLVPVSTRPTDVSFRTVFVGRVPQEAELENAAASLILRAIPLRTGGDDTGALILLRDVTELRRRERELMTKEATIREIHHRVKNNLQTVAALLRLQARRLDAPEGRKALEEAVRRVGSIALVHETLSQRFDETVEFDEVADRLRRMVVEVSSELGEVTSERHGTFGVLPAETATPLAMVLTELLQNAAEHAFDHRSGGRIWVEVGRTPAGLRLSVLDDGVGLPADLELESLTSLGMSIVSTLVESELGGTLAWGSNDRRGAGGGTRVDVDVPLG